MHATNIRISCLNQIYLLNPLCVNHCHSSFLKNGPCPASFYFICMFSIKLMVNQWMTFRRWLDSNRGPLVLEATALPTEPQPLPFFYIFVNRWKPVQIHFLIISKFLLFFSLLPCSNLEQMFQKARQADANIWFLNIWVIFGWEFNLKHLQIFPRTSSKRTRTVGRGKYLCTYSCGQSYKALYDRNLRL